VTKASFYTVGKARVVRVLDCALDTFRLQQPLPEWQDHDQQLAEQLPEALAAGQHVSLSIHSWVIEHQGKIFIVDTGAGNDKDRPHAPYFHRLTTPYLARLNEIGVSPDNVDYVLHTHLHVDHVGWNTVLVDGRWIPTLRNARHIFSAKEFAYFTDPGNLTERNRTSFQVQMDSVKPIVAAGLAEMIETTGDEVIPGFRFYPTPGHTVEHASIVLESEGVRAIFAGDVLHHPIQILKPELMSVFDPERERTLTSRRWALDFSADYDAIWFSSHFPDSSAGRVARAGNGYRWSFE